MDESNSLRETLESLTKVYHEETTPVKFGSPSRAVPTGEPIQGETVAEPTVVVDPAVNDRYQQELTGPEELRCLTNTLSHELEHIRETELTSKAEFAKEYEQYPQFAGAIINILEDQYIDYTRTQRFPGLKSTQAFVIEQLLQDDERWPPINSVDSPQQAMMEGVRQIAFAGYPKGDTIAADWLQEFLSRVRPLISRVRRESNQQQRKNIAHTVMDIAQEYLPDADLQMPETCAICGIQPPVIVAPILGPVCEDCVPTGHGKHDSNGEGSSADTEAGLIAENPDITEDVTVALTQLCSDAGSEDSSQSVEMIRGHPLEREQTTDDTQATGDLAKQLQSDVPLKEGALSQDMDVGSWWEVPAQVDHQTVSEQDVSRYERIQREKQANQGLSAELKERREKALDSGWGISETHAEHSGNLKQSEDWRRLRDEHRRMFRKITTHDMPVPTRKGVKLNLDNIIQRAAGDISQDKLYDRSQPIARGDSIVAVTADMSGSMDGYQVRLALAAIAEATSIVGDEFLATCWREAGRPTGGYLCKRGSTGFGLICDIDEPFQWQQLDTFGCNGSTPTADGVHLTGQLIADRHAREKLLIVITDGRPNVNFGEMSDASTGDPVEDTAQVVQRIKSKNIKVIGLYIGSEDDDAAMADIFGNRMYVSSSIDELAEELVEIYRRQMDI